MTDCIEKPVFWLERLGCSFGFAEPARFVEHKDGGYFASVATGEELPSMAQNGFRDPSRGLAPWATLAEHVKPGRGN